MRVGVTNLLIISHCGTILGTNKQVYACCYVFRDLTPVQEMRLKLRRNEDASCVFSFLHVFTSFVK